MRSMASVSALTLFCLFSCGEVGKADEPPRKEHVWEGTLKVQPGIDLRLVFHVREANGGGFVATVDSPDQGAAGLKVDSTVLDSEKLVFEMKALVAKFEGTLNADRTEAAGTFTQRGMSFPLTLAKKDKPTPEPKIEGKELVWEGKLSLHAGLSYRFVVFVGKTDAGTWVGRLDSPDEGFKGLKLDPLTLDKENFTFELKISAAKYEGKLNAEGTEITGTWSQRGVRLPLNFKKVDKPTEVRRPQTPKPPFPYKVETVTYRNEDASVMLAGTLTEPEGGGPFPAVVLISGSGTQDRDETLFQHKPFLVLADSLTRRGVAVLRVDDRGVGGSSGSLANATSEDFAGDVSSGVTFLRSRPEIDRAKIGLIGHSEGGLIAPIVASRSNDIAFIVLLAGTGLPGDEIIMLQVERLSRVLGLPDSDMELRLTVQRRILDIAKSDEDDDVALEKMRALVKELGDRVLDADAKDAGGLKGTLEPQLKTMQTRWYRHFLRYDPRPTLAKVRCPVLALIGEKDLQVPPRENLPEIKKALEQGGNTQATVKELPELNHLFQTCKTGSTKEYAELEETFAPAALKVIGDWIKGRVKAR